MPLHEKSQGLLDLIFELLDMACDEETQATIFTILSIAEDVVILGLKLLRKTV
jgi:hypothetical protein